MVITRQLGDGGFGTVYKATLKQEVGSHTLTHHMYTTPCHSYNDSCTHTPHKHKFPQSEVVNIAVKQFHSDIVCIEQDSWTMAENKAWDVYQKASQEARVMLPLSHPHILGLIGLALQPVRLLVEIAPMGDLKYCVKAFQKARVPLSRATLQATLIQVMNIL